MNDLVEYVELKPWLWAAVGVLGLAGIVVAARNLSRRPGFAALALIVSSATAIICLLEAWDIADHPPSHVSTFAGCSLFLLMSQAGATAALMLLCMTGRRIGKGRDEGAPENPGQR